MVFGLIRIKILPHPSEEEEFQEGTTAAVSKFPNIPITSHQKDYPGKPQHWKPQRLTAFSLAGFFPHTVGDHVLHAHLKCPHFSLE